MLVRNLKCNNCGAVKVNEISTGYIYCDYCSALIGFDMKTVHEEIEDVFNSEVSEDRQNKFNEAAVRMGRALNDNNADEFIKAHSELKMLEFDLFPKRFSPKAKQMSYRRQYLRYYEAYWTERIEDDYFNKAKKFQGEISPLSDKLESKVENNKIFVSNDQAFEEYLAVLSDYIKGSIEETLNMKSIELYPEPYKPSFNMLYKQSIDASLQMFEKETAMKAIEFLGLQTEYITTEAISFTEKECIVCSEKLNVPETGKSILCEKCGNVNHFESNKIQCLVCAAPIAYEETNSCEYCGARYFSHDHTEEDDKPEDEQTLSAGEFFKKLFS